jgi:prepilin-type N-terminal cleavage/methylation domain-containing protein
MKRPGFTLLEVMVAIVLTSAISLLVYGTARAGIDTNERLAEVRAHTTEQIAVRNLLTDVLRHPAEEGGASMNELLFDLQNRVTSTGLPFDLLSVVSANNVVLTVEATEAGVVVSSAGARQRLTSTRGLNVRFLDRADDARWLDGWDIPGRVPAAVSIEFLTADGQPALAPIIVRTALETRS